MHTITSVPAERRDEFLRDEARQLLGRNEGMTKGRRSFLRAMAGGALGSLALPRFAYADDDFFARWNALAKDAEFWDKVRAQFTLDPAVTYMNIGTTGAQAKSVQDKFAERNMAIARNPLENFGGSVPVREALAAAHVGDKAYVDEFAVPGNTTHGMAAIIIGFDWKAGDEVLITNHEHPAINSIYMMRDRYGIVVTPVAMPTGPGVKAQNIVDAFAAKIGPKTRALMWSDITFLTGTRLPSKRLAQLAMSRGLVSMVDGAHTLGMMDVNLHDMGVDFFAGTGHKWQCGPANTGTLYIRNRVLPQFNPMPLPKFYPTVSASYSAANGNPPRNTGATSTDNIGGRFQIPGQSPYPALWALKDATELWASIGKTAIQDYDLSLSLYLKNELAKRLGADRLYAPKDDPELLCALTSFNPFQNAADITNATKSAEFVTRLRTEYGFVVRNTTVPVIGSTANHVPLRVSTHLFHDFDDVNGLVASIMDLSMKMA